MHASGCIGNHLYPPQWTESFNNTTPSSHHHYLTSFIRGYPARACAARGKVISRGVREVIKPGLNSGLWTGLDSGLDWILDWTGFWTGVKEF